MLLIYETCKDFKVRPSTAEFPHVTDPSLKWEIDTAVLLRGREILADIQAKAMADFKRKAQQEKML